MTENTTPFSYVLTLAEENIQLNKEIWAIHYLMLSISHGKRAKARIIKDLNNRASSKELHTLIGFVDKAPSRYRTRALAILFYLYGISPQLNARFLFVYHKTIKRYIRRYQDEGIDKLLSGKHKGIRMVNDPYFKEAVFSTLHTPPSSFGINRTTWNRKLLLQVLRNEGFNIGRNTMDRIIKKEGYRFLKDREVLTSNDPQYKEKLKKITRILKRLGPKDRFLSIDEYGPFSVKERTGRRLVRKGEYPTVPQFQYSKGFFVITAALELSTNKVTHFYSKKKDTVEMIKLLEKLLKQYKGCRRIYLSWDAASWHSSKVFLKKVKDVNRLSYRKETNFPMVKLAPLPTRAQFLNVIESVFSGMAGAVLNNSNYPSVEKAKRAVDLYFKERNTFFKKNPKRAGNKIWGEEIEPSYFSVGHNCKNKRWTR